MVYCYFWRDFRSFRGFEFDCFGGATCFGCGCITTCATRYSIAVAANELKLSHGHSCLVSSARVGYLGYYISYGTGREMLCMYLNFLSVNMPTQKGVP